MHENPIAFRMNSLAVQSLKDLGAQKESLCIRCVRINSEQRVLLERLRKDPNNSGRTEAKRLFAESFSLQREFFSLVRELKRIDEKLALARKE